MFNNRVGPTTQYMSDSRNRQPLEKQQEARQQNATRPTLEVCSAGCEEYCKPVCENAADWAACVVCTTVCSDRNTPPPNNCCGVKCPCED